MAHWKVSLVAAAAAVLLPSAVLADAQLHGHWVETQSPTMQMTLNGDGTGVYLGATMRWQADGQRIAITLGEGGATMPLEPARYSLSGDRLQVWVEGLPTPTVWQRQR